MRTFDVNLVEASVKQYATAIENFDAFDWLLDKDNIALINDNKDIALFERNYLNAVSVFGHYFFWSRGKEAIKAAEEFVKEIFTNESYGVEVITGLTPVTHKGALWMNKRLGFRELEIISSRVGDLMMVILTKQDWEQHE